MSSFWVAAALAAALNQSPANQAPAHQSTSAPAPPRTSAPAPSNPFINLVPNLGKDLRSLGSGTTAIVMGIGGAGTIITHRSDARVHDWAVKQPIDPGLADFGNVLGDVLIQGGAAVGTWVAGKQSNNVRLESTGSDLIRAQILNGVLTIPIKLIVNRERPNGGHRSFPSGHTSATFATAAVIQRDYGVAASVPFYALGGIVGWARVRTSHHWMSDGVFGAAIGITSGLAVTKGRTSHWTIVPAKTKGGAALFLIRR